MTLYEAEREFRRQVIRSALIEAGGSRTVAARVLGLNRLYLVKLMRDLGITDVPPKPRRTLATP